ncbi:hypothetical protein ALC62_09823 [Cyphomyrmex costatus]|uniref:Uncharacterized protein n=1 Tax=Cyphomyrmex costatus TaxID=456900 RepID=A0A195CGF1_9HYME|nr:hypothetical protein ALC62_09823 [Cyphomyrmex costatus]
MAQKVKPVRGADADSVARTVHELSSSSSSSFLGADTERSTAISTLTGGKQRRVLAQVKVRSRGSTEKARKTRSEKRSSSESGIHREEDQQEGGSNEAI